MDGSRFQQSRSEFFFACRESSGTIRSSPRHPRRAQLPRWRARDLRSGRTPMEVEMKIRGLMMDPVTTMPIVVLKDIQGNSVLPIWVGIYEANAIALEIEKVQTPRPMT